MVRMPKNIIAAMHMGQGGSIETKKTIVDELIRAGYGKTKAENWFNTFIDTGDIYAVGSDAVYGYELYTTKWWTHCTMPPRRRKSTPRINADLLTEEEHAILRGKAE